MNTINGLQTSLAAYQTASNQFMKSTVPSNENSADLQTAQSLNAQPKPTLENAAINLNSAEKMSEANIKALKTEDQLIGRLLDIQV